MLPTPARLASLTAERDRARADAHRARQAADGTAGAYDVAARELDQARAALSRVRAELAAAADLAVDQNEVIDVLRAELRDAREDARHHDATVGGLVKSRLLVFLGGTEGGVFDGLLLEADDRTLTFADVHRRTAEGNSQSAAPGELYIDRARIRYMQRITAEQGQAL